jgi:hypothetical protein
VFFIVPLDELANLFIIQQRSKNRKLIPFALRLAGFIICLVTGNGKNTENS